MAMTSNLIGRLPEGSVLPGEHVTNDLKNKMAE